MNDFINTLKVYIADEGLAETAKNIIENTAKMFGGNPDLPKVVVEVANFGGVNWNFNQWTNPQSSYSAPTGSSQPVWTTGTITSGSNAASGTITLPSNVSNVGVTFSNPSTTTVTGTFTNYWQSAPYTVNIGNAGSPLTPDQVPASKAFEELLLSSIKQLNEAYNLGRLHGYVQGREEGAVHENEQLKKAMDTEILEYEELAAK